MRKIYHFTKEQLEYLYVKQGLSLNKIAKEIGCNSITILNTMENFGIKRKPNNFNKINIPKETLEELYLNKKLSLNQIARQLGLTQITILRRLKEANIERRPAYRKKIFVPKEVLTELYWNQKKKPKEIAKMFGIKDGRTIRKKMEKFGIKRRTQSEALTVKMKKPFIGDLSEKAYLLGLRAGDFYAKKNHLCIRIQTSTTHPAQIDLLRNALGHYAQVCTYLQKSTIKNGITRDSEWYIYADLHPTFEFLLEKPKEIPKWVLEEKNYFYNFLAAYSDCEGCFMVNKSHKNDIRFTFRLATCDLEILKNIHERLKEMHFHPIFRLQSEKGYKIKNSHLNNNCYVIVLNRKQEFITLANHMLTLGKHSEKIRKMRLT